MLTQNGSAETRTKTQCVVTFVKVPTAGCSCPLVSHLVIIVIVAYLVLPDADEPPPRSGPLWLPELAVACQQKFRHLGAAARQSVALFPEAAFGLLTA